VESVSAFFEERGQPKLNPVSQLNHFVQVFEAAMKQVFFLSHTNYYDQLAPSAQAGFVKMCVGVLTYDKDAFASFKYPGGFLN
jgi:hypothetical protein